MNCFSSFSNNNPSVHSSLFNHINNYSSVFLSDAMCIVSWTYIFWKIVIAVFSLTEKNFFHRNSIFRKVWTVTKAKQSTTWKKRNLLIITVTILTDFCQTSEPKTSYMIHTSLKHDNHSKDEIMINRNKKPFLNN